MVKSMRVILITGDGLGHRYVANRMAREVSLAGIIVDHGRNIRRVERMLRLIRKYSPAQLVSRVMWALISRIWRDKTASGRAMLAVLGPENCSHFSHPNLLHHVHGINTPEGIGAVSSLDPDVILVFGTGIVGKQVLSRARKTALNMHTGISPYYRGCDCYFWPLYNRELHMLGATVHECVREIDGGRIFATTGIELQPDDDLFMVFARCISAGADLYVKKVRELADHDLSGTTQDLSIGTEYKAHQKGFLAEWKVRRAIHSGLIRQFVGTPVAIPRDSVRPLHPVKREGPSAGMKSENSVRVDVPSGAHKK
jgi:methionyl-tRNA formyltransferase